ncbi:MAG: hypothetical protein FJ216_11815 [Ignavibacteria bacterium]|nr:hypothetical protein [Ignavibacteria bacterium]
MNSLSEKHKRAVSSTIHILEKSIDEMMYMLTNHFDGTSYKVKEDIDDKRKTEILKKIKKLKKLIENFSAEYKLNKNVIIQSRVFESKKTFWGIYLEDISSDRLNKKYGAMSVDEKEYDGKLQNMINFIKSL